VVEKWSVGVMLAVGSRSRDSEVDGAFGEDVEHRPHGSLPRIGPEQVLSKIVLVGEVAYSVREKPQVGVSILISSLTSRSSAEASNR
jgi:hypothetical protein